MNSFYYYFLFWVFCTFPSIIGWMIIRRVIAKLDDMRDSGKIMVGEVALIAIIGMIPIINIVMTAAAMVFGAIAIVCYIIAMLSKQSEESIFGKRVEDVVAGWFDPSRWTLR